MDYYLLAQEYIKYHDTEDEEGKMLQFNNLEKSSIILFGLWINKIIREKNGN
jgi:hypothetical protein